MPPKSLPKPVEIKISTVVAMAVILHDAHLAVLDVALKKLTGHSSDYYSEECAVIDVGNIDCSNMDWTALIQLLRSHGFRPVAVRHAPEQAEEQIAQLGLSIDLGSNNAERPTPASNVTPITPIQVKAVPKPVLLNTSIPSLIIDTPVRGGQRIYAKGCDLILTAVVNSGAEVIADGNIHIYAPLRGRALAGANGNTAARIFTMSLEAELVSIAGIYRTFENGHPSFTPPCPVQIKLDGDKLDVAPIQSHN